MRTTATKLLEKRLDGSGRTEVDLIESCAKQAIKTRNRTQVVRNIQTNPTIDPKGLIERKISGNIEEKVFHLGNVDLGRF